MLSRERKRLAHYSDTVNTNEASSQTQSNKIESKLKLKLY